VVGQSPANERGWITLATMYLNRNDLARSFDAATEGLTQLPQNRALMLIKAGVEARRSPGLAIGTLRQLADERPEDAQIALNLATMYAKAGQYKEAIELLEERLAAADEPDRRGFEVVRAVVLLESGRIAEAGEKFDALYAADPDDAGIVISHTQALGRHKAWAQLTSLAVDWLGRHPNTPGVLSTIVQNLTADDASSVEARKAAEDILRQVLAANEKSLEALNSMAMLMHMQGRMAEAAKCYERVLNIEPDRLVVLNNLAWILCEDQKQYVRARQLVDRGLAINPNYVDLIDTSGMIYLRTGEYDKAVAEFTRCIRLYPPNAPGLAGSSYHLALAYEKVGRRQDAIAHVRKAIEHGGLSREDSQGAESLLARLVN